MLAAFQIGGAEKFVLSLLDKHNTENFEWAACVLWPEQNADFANEFKEKVTCFNLDLPHWSFKRPVQAFIRIYKAVRSFRRLCHEYKPDVVHAHLPWPSIITLMALAFSDIPVVTTYHNTNLSGRLSIQWLRKLMVRIVKPVCIACGQTAKEANAKNGMFPEERCVVVSTGVDTDRYDRNAVNVAVKNPFDDHPNALHIVQLGSFVPQKGHQYTIEALSILRDRGIAAYVCAVGMGGNIAKFEKLAEDKGVSDSIMFIGATEDEKMKLLQTADIYIMPSLWEGLSLAMLEGMSMELPLIISNVGGALEVIEDGVNGLLINTRDAKMLAAKIELLAGNERLRQTLGQNARKTVLEKFSLRQRTTELEKLYQEVVNKN